MWIKHNLDDVLSAFWNLVEKSVSLAERIIREAARRAEELIRERAPRRTGRLVRSVSSTIEGNRALVGVRVDYARFLEWGTRPHEIRPRHARALRFVIRGRVIFAKRVWHPGVRPRFFVLSAAEALRAELDDLTSGVVEDVLG